MTGFLPRGRTCQECRKAGQQKVCVVAECGKPTRSPTSDHCAMHYHRVWRHGDVDADFSRPDYTFNEHAFDVLTPETAWVLGLIWSDGCLQANGVNIVSVERQHLEEAERVIGGINCIKQRKDGVAWYVLFTSAHTASVLRSHGLTESKSLSIEWPVGVPEAMFYDFLRGVFDGDGSFSLAMRYKRPESVPGAVWRIATGSPAFAQRLMDELRSRGFRPFLGKKESPGGFVYSPTVQNIPGLRSLYERMYRSDGVPCLHRKRDAWKAWLDIPRPRCGRKKIFQGIPDEKACSRCKETKPASEFYRCLDRLQSVCKDCSRVVQKDRITNADEETRERMRMLARASQERHRARKKSPGDGETT